MNKRRGKANGIDNSCYNNYINSALRELVSQGVEYVEISYSIRQILLNFEIDDDIIRAEFLLLLNYFPITIFF